MATPTPRPTIDPNNPYFPPVATVPSPMPTPTVINPKGGLPGATPTPTPTKSGSGISAPVVSGISSGVDSSGNPISYTDLIQIPPSGTNTGWTTGYYDAATKSTIWAAAYVDPATGNINVTTDQTGYHKAYLNQLVQMYGSILGAKNAFAKIANGLGGTVNKAKASIAAGNTEDSILAATIDAAIGNTSRTIIYSEGKTAPTIASYIDGRPNYAGTRESTTTNYTSKDAAWVDVDKFMMDYVGRHASVKEFNDYYTKLNTYEKTHPIKATVTMDGLGVERNRVQTDGPTADDKLAVLVASVTPSLEAIGKDPSAISKVGGQLAVNTLKLQQRAMQQGVSDYYDQGKAFEAAVNSIQPGATVEGEIAKIDSLAISLPKYSSIANSLKAGFTVSDIAKPINDKRNTLLERNDTIDFSNPIFIKGLTGGANGGIMNDDELSRLIKSDPSWRFTQNARESAAGFLNQVGQMMGFIG